MLSGLGAPCYYMMPFLCNMSSSRRVVTHSDEGGHYVIVVKPKVGLVAAFGLTLLADQAWPADLSESEDFRSSDAGIVQAQRIKAMHPLVFDELKRIQAMAERNSVPPENVLLVDCNETGWTPEMVGTHARDALDRDASFATLRSNSLWPGVGNRVGLYLTDVFIDEIWGMDGSREAI